MELFDFKLKLTISHIFSSEIHMTIDIINPKFYHHIHDTNVIQIYASKIPEECGIYNFSNRSITPNSNDTISKYYEKFIKEEVKNIQEYSKMFLNQLQIKFEDNYDYKGMCKHRKGHIKLSLNKARLNIKEKKKVQNVNNLRNNLKKEPFKKYKFI